MDQIAVVDRHLRRTGDDYAAALADLLPTGPVWPRDEDSVLMRLVRGLANIFGFVDSRAADFLETESDPRKTIEMLDRWEENWGLPDPCFKSALTLAERQKMLVFKMTLLGAQNRQWFIDVAAWLGYNISISEFAPFTCGVSQVGDTRGMELWNDTPGQHPELMEDFRWEIGPPEIRFFWQVHVHLAPLMWFRVGSGEAGLDPHLRIGYAQDLECLIDRWKPAHTLVVYDYSNLTPPDKYAGLP
jgi:uncharacterized protein YmfQ (DUF2313 family)